MASDEQRREAAKELRKLATPGCIRYAEEFYEELREIVAFDHDGSFDGVANSLADLIDRPTCETIEHGRPDESHVCKSCSRCSYGWFEDIHDKPYSYCPNCGAEVVDE